MRRYREARNRLTVEFMALTGSEYEAANFCLKAAQYDLDKAIEVYTKHVTKQPFTHIPPDPQEQRKIHYETPPTILEMLVGFILFCFLFVISPITCLVHNVRSKTKNFPLCADHRGYVSALWNSFGTNAPSSLLKVGLHFWLFLEAKGFCFSSFLKAESCVLGVCGKESFQDAFYGAISRSFPAQFNLNRSGIQFFPFTMLVSQVHRASVE